MTRGRKEDVPCSSNSSNSSSSSRAPRDGKEDCLGSSVVNFVDEESGLGVEDVADMMAM